MNIDNIFLALNESYRKAIISIIACTLMTYPILYFSIGDFKDFDWYAQLLLASGIASCYIGFYVTWTIAAIKNSDVFLFPIALVATCSLVEVMNWAYTGNCTLLGFLFKLIGLSFISIALIYILVYRNKR